MIRFSARAAAFALAWALPAGAGDPLVPYAVRGGAIEESLTGAPGDPARGRAVAAGRDGNCLACHPAPIPEEQFHGDIGPDLRGVGSRLSPGELRLRIVDPKRIDETTIMPSYYKVEGLERVARAFAGRPILNAARIEDLVAWLAALKDGADDGAPPPR